MRLHQGVVAICFGGVVGCSSSNNSSNSTSGGGDSGPPATFTQVYTNVISNRCAPCHTTATGIGVVTGKLDMTTQTAAYMNLVNVAAAGSQCSGKGTRVVPGQKDMSIMYLKVSLDDPSPCGGKMPLGGPPLAAGDVAAIESWITAGALNN
jgi:hypothetical protein